MKMRQLFQFPFLEERCITAIEFYDHSLTPASFAGMDELIAGRIYLANDDHESQGPNVSENNCCYSNSSVYSETNFYLRQGNAF